MEIQCVILNKWKQKMEWGKKKYNPKEENDDKK